MTTPSWNAITWRRLGYLLLGLPLHLAAFTVTVTLVTLGLGVSILVFGAFILAAGLLFARACATAERQVMHTLLGGAPAPQLVYRPAHGSRLQRLRILLTDPQSWLDVAWVALAFITSVLTWSLTIILLTLAVGSVLGPIMVLLFNGPLGHLDGSMGIGELLGLPMAWLVDIGLYLLLGFAAVRLGPAAIAGLTSLQSGVGEFLLNSRARQEQRYDDLFDSRQAAHRAEADSLRRLERDIHDGPQQRLVRLNMDLARARRKMATSPETAEDLLVQAMQQTQDTLAELRNLSRGIAPPVLVDRGLAAAVEEVVANSTIPARCSVTSLALPPHVEQAAYFVVAEALTNANKHSGAQRILVEVLGEPDAVQITVADDGAGGADLAKGHGLAGLEQRLQGLGGTLTVASPAGGPTILEAVIPCAS
ncbi:sensor domain-containing protein [Arachnia propionica]|uniref:histidine kinase n=1 Tax=Arachnia propionica TaxID=1750 RepID=A0A3P1WUG5_9ACTN|nr:sensor domain-containing protein [Arachnia propionica]RRD49841.1 sensor histidine kinase [Arachnia propionica]